MASQKLITERAILGKYYARLEKPTTPLVEKLAMEINSSQDSEKHAWLGMPPAMREWIGGRQAKKFRASDFTIINKDFESTVEYHERERTEDKTGQLDVRLNEHADRAVSHDESLMSTLIEAAESAVCYDGQYFFDTDHVEGDSGTQSNDLSYNVTTPTAPTPLEMQAAILESIQAIIGFKDDQGEPMNQNAKSFLVMVPIPFWSPARTAIGATVISDGSNTATGLISGWDDIKIELQMNPRSTWTTKFSTYRTDGSVKPFIQQVREKATVDILGEGSDHFFNTRCIKASIKKAGNMGLGLWQGAALTTLT
jgi:phage major head subunit gpT-like protein